MPVKPVFSIIVPVYNRPEELDELLVSILAQEYNEVFDVYIIEDGSSRNDKEIGFVLILKGIYQGFGYTRRKFR